MREGKFMKTACSADVKHKNSTDSNAKFKDVLLYLHDLVYLLGFGLLILLLCFKIVIVSGSSMKNTLIDGDYLLLLGNTFYRDPQYGDIIVASKDSYEDGTPIVKRVIATEGQTVDIDFLNGIVYIDDVALDEPYVSSIMMDEGVSFPLTVEKGCLFVMGDNRLV
ncbi:MAG: signal peptidase I, partial [Lachnospiraceae bacterium]|nr:signal peptidase I [Lachnospiraceae bacterium]